MFDIHNTMVMLEIFSLRQTPGSPLGDKSQGFDESLNAGKKCK